MYLSKDQLNQKLMLMVRVLGIVSYSFRPLTRELIGLEVWMQHMRPSYLALKIPFRKKGVDEI